MRFPRRLVWGALASLLLIGSTPATVQADAARTSHGGDCPVQNRVRVVNNAPTVKQVYYHGDWRLGPKDLPRTGRIGEILRGYNRLGGKPQDAFFQCYWQTNLPTGQSGWWFPSNSGFVIRNQQPVERRVTLRAGTLLDLFGRGDSGHFLAAAGTPFGERAIPPSNLITFEAAHPNSYHLYRVDQDFTVQAGPTRPWFAQPGLALQYATVPSVGQLKEAHYLTELPVT
ncbi:TNT domain-containing protein [Streptomyces sp. HUAS TT20]|uniref:TNT domain-containing protein n=1 Tax=Streptomyces sp. HUAS TT20 TaxID=3447509 RepID=UPI0021D82773|nr:TNT domain-containing protein [Streptomyces sp. HUAS 15-9]UXY29920.1 TNT domain-containing protein [Streptomyces sp. HUAS 15-9]